MCPVGADQEAAYLAALSSAQTYQIVGPNMQITYDGGVLNFTSLNLPLENVIWQALVLNGQAIPPEVEITALFNPGDDANSGTVGGRAACNNYSTGYETDGDLLTIASPMALTRAMCPDETLANLESSYLAALETAESYDILGDQMVIRTAGGDIIYTADREPLLGTLWTLISLGSINDPQPEDAVHLERHAVGVVPWEFRTYRLDFSHRRWRNRRHRLAGSFGNVGERARCPLCVL